MIDFLLGPMLAIGAIIVALLFAAHWISIGTPYVVEREDQGYWIVYRRGFLGMNEVDSVHWTAESAYLRFNEILGE